MTDDRQTDHGTEKCVVGIGGITCAARAILPNNTLLSSAFKKLVDVSG